MDLISFMLHTRTTAHVCEEEKMQISKYNKILPCMLEYLGKLILQLSVEFQNMNLRIVVSYL